MVNLSPAPTEGKRRPGFSIADALYLFVCCSVAMTIAVPQPPEEALFPGWEVYQPHLDWHYALLSVTTIGAIGVLLGQARQLRQASGGWFAIAERRVVAGLLLLALAIRLFTQRGVLELGSESGLHIRTLRQMQDSIWVLLLVIGISIAAGERSRGRRNLHGWAWAGLTAAVAWLVLLIVTDLGIIPLLVHVAIDGIEARTPPRFAVVASTADLGVRHSAAQWSLVASLSCMAAIVATVAALTLRDRSPAAVLLAGVAACGLAIAAWFSAWYYSQGLAELSPCLAGATPMATWTDAVTGGLIVFVVSVWIARCQGKRPKSAIGDEAPRIPRLNSQSLLLLIAGGIGASGIALLESAYASISSALGAQFGGFVMRWSGWADTVTYWLIDSQNLLLLALLLVSVRLLNVCRRAEPVGLADVDARRFLLLTLLLLLIAAVGAPTLAAYSFCSWLGPWHL